MDKQEILYILTEILDNYLDANGPYLSLCGAAREIFVDRDYEYVLFKRYIKDSLSLSSLNFLAWPPYEQAPRIQWLEDNIKALRRELQ
jgi:hypothetical protein